MLAKFINALIYQNKEEQVSYCEVWSLFYFRKNLDNQRFYVFPIAETYELLRENLIYSVIKKTVYINGPISLPIANQSEDFDIVSRFRWVYNSKFIIAITWEIFPKSKETQEIGSSQIPCFQGAFKFHILLEGITRNLQKKVIRKHQNLKGLRLICGNHEHRIMHETLFIMSIRTQGHQANKDCNNQAKEIVDKVEAQVNQFRIEFYHSSALILSLYPLQNVQNRQVLSLYINFGQVFHYNNN